MIIAIDNILNIKEKFGLISSLLNLCINQSIKIMATTKDIKKRIDKLKVTVLDSIKQLLTHFVFIITYLSIAKCQLKCYRITNQNHRKYQYTITLSENQ